VAAAPATPTPATNAPATNAPATSAPVSKFVPQPDAKTVVQQGGPQAPPQTPPAKKDTAKAAKPTPSAADTKVAATPPAATKPGTSGAPAPAPTTTAAKPNTPTSTAPSTAVPVFRPTPASGDSAKSLVMRETFAYSRDARRDPFVSLMTTSDLRPTMSDLRLTGILYDLSGRRPVAILRDLAGGQWRVTTGMTLGRMRVAQIKPKTVIFTIEEFGFSRNDSLLLGDTTRVRVIR
jgi:hypothetical protein